MSHTQRSHYLFARCEFIYEISGQLMLNDISFIHMPHIVQKMELMKYTILPDDFIKWKFYHFQLCVVWLVCVLDSVLAVLHRTIDIAIAGTLDVPNSII